MTSSGTLTRIGGALRSTFRRERDDDDVDQGFFALLGTFGDDFFGDDVPDD